MDVAVVIVDGVLCTFTCIYDICVGSDVVADVCDVVVVSIAFGVVTVVNS